MFPAVYFPPAYYAPTFFFDPSASTSTQPTIMAAVCAALLAAPGVTNLIGQKLYADEADPATTLPSGTLAYPYALYSDAEETANRTVATKGWGKGVFELGAFATTKDGATALMAQLKSALQSLPLQSSPVALGDGGSWFYCLSVKNTQRPIAGTSPTGTPEYGQVLQFTYMVARPIP